MNVQRQGRGSWNDIATGKRLGTYSAAAIALLPLALDLLAALGAGGVVGLVDGLHSGLFVWGGGIGCREMADSIKSLTLYRKARC